MPHFSHSLRSGAYPQGASLAFALAAVGTAALASSVVGVIEARVVVVVAAVALFGATAAIALRSARRSHGHRSFGPANVVTTIRAAIVAVIASLVAAPSTANVGIAAAVLGTVAVALDGVDGALARRTGLSSEFGARFDMEIDALLILALCVLTWWHGRAGLWVITSGLLRYAFVAAGWLWAWMRRPLEPSRRRQATCVVQIAALLVILTPWVPQPSASVIAAMSVATLCYSFLVDVRWLWSNAR